jgi:hypothetical protein
MIITTKAQDKGAASGTLTPVTVNQEDKIIKSKVRMYEICMQIISFIT